MEFSISQIPKLCKFFFIHIIFILKTNKNEWKFSKNEISFVKTFKKSANLIR
jgi:hypothetical protein